MRAILYKALLVTCLTVISLQGYSQKGPLRVFPVYRGFEASTGIQKADIVSNIAALNGLKWIAEGGQVSLVGGSEAFLSRIGIGLFYSSGSVKQTIDLFVTEAAFNFYPLELSPGDQSRLKPYLTGGAFYNLYKFSGTYLQQETGRQNYSTSAENYIGRISQLNVAVGGGIEFRFLDEYEFLVIYLESKYGVPVLIGTETPAFAETSTRSVLQVQLGFRAGLKRKH